MTAQSNDKPVIILDSLEAVQGLKQGDICKISPTAETTFCVDITWIYHSWQIYLTTTDSMSQEEWDQSGYDYFKSFKHMRQTYKGSVIFGAKEIWSAIQTGRYIIG